MRAANVTLVCGLGFGDEGKGTTVDALCRARDAKLVVRYNGGAQAAHNVVERRGSGERHHTFAQFGSGTFAGARTLLSRFVHVNPIALLAEAKHLSAIGVADPLSLVRIEAGALVTTPFHVAVNRLREIARTGRHGSCGMGIGETTSDALAHPDEALRVGDLRDPSITRAKLEAVRARMIEATRALTLTPSDAALRERFVLEDAGTIDACVSIYAELALRVAIVSASFLPDSLANGGDVVLEGAQGVLLDQSFGFQPHTTWTDITWRNADALLADFEGDVTRVGVLRAYATRHGAGPFVTERADFDPLSAHDHNRAPSQRTWQGSFRSGAFDVVSARYAIEVLGGIDALAITNLDRLALLPGDGVPIATAYEDVPQAFFHAPDRIRVNRPATFEWQAALARALATLRPRAEMAQKAGYSNAIAARLGVPILLESFGPTADDKRLKSRPRAPSILREAHGSLRP